MLLQPAISCSSRRSSNDTSTNKKRNETGYLLKLALEPLPVFIPLLHGVNHKHDALSDWVCLELSRVCPYPAKLPLWTNLYHCSLVPHPIPSHIHLAPRIDTVTTCGGIKLA